MSDKPTKSASQKQIEALEAEAREVLKKGQRDEQIDALIALKLIICLSKPSPTAADMKVAMDYLKFRGYSPVSPRHLKGGNGAEADQAGHRLDDLLDRDALPPGVLDEHPADAVIA